ncbi:substrate-binding periplasmic protein [Marinobacter nauticus]|uniref:substrate-binding periplasmic protein n=1 Tax=Marinobacter nauticus TaxID=2743 RepID=UPI001CF7B812|nr:transporter substrate-binding domain-containing protein [Marinobacter nauticus]
MALFLVLVFSYLFYPTAVRASDSEAIVDKTIRVAYVEFPPVTYRDDRGEPAGEFVDITRKVAAEAGYQLEFIYLPVARTYLYLKNGTIDLWMGLTDIPALKDDIFESWISPIPVELSAWYLEGLPPVDHMDRLRNKTVILIGGYTYAGLRDWLTSQPDIQITEAPNHRSGLNMLKRHRGDYLLDYRQPVQETLSRTTDAEIRESEMRSRNGAWLFSLANPRAAILREAFDDAYLRLAEKGEVPPVRRFQKTYVVPGFPEQYR